MHINSTSEPDWGHKPLVPSSKWILANRKQSQVTKYRFESRVESVSLTPVSLLCMKYMTRNPRFTHRVAYAADRPIHWSWLGQCSVRLTVKFWANLCHRRTAWYRCLRWRPQHSAKLAELYIAASVLGGSELSWTCRQNATEVGDMHDWFVTSSQLDNELVFTSCMFTSAPHSAPYKFAVSDVPFSIASFRRLLSLCYNYTLSNVNTRRSYSKILLPFCVRLR